MRKALMEARTMAIDSDSDVIGLYANQRQMYGDMAAPLLAIGTLTQLVEHTKNSTIMGLKDELVRAGAALERAAGHEALSVAAGCDIFWQYVTRTSLERPHDFEWCRAQLLARGRRFVDKGLRSREAIAGLAGGAASALVQDGSVLLVHGYSRVVFETLAAAAQAGRRFRVVLTEARAGGSASLDRAIEALHRHSIPTTLVLDAALGPAMEQVDSVLLGAQLVVENGGIINLTGTLTVAVLAKAMNRPVYVAAESFKFARRFPLDCSDYPVAQGEWPDASRRHSASMSTNINKDDIDLAGDAMLTLHCPTTDYTPPRYIDLLFTDLGVLTPAAVSDELIQLYQGAA